MGGAPKSVADQAIRAASSAALNIEEGYGRGGADRYRFWRIAYGSAREATMALQILVRGGVLKAEAADEPLQLLDRTRAMLWRLLQRR